MQSACNLFCKKGTLYALLINETQNFPPPLLMIVCKLMSFSGLHIFALTPIPNGWSMASSLDRKYLRNLCTVSGHIVTCTIWKFVLNVPNSKLSSDLLASISSQLVWAPWKCLLQSVSCYFVEKQVPEFLLLLRTIFFKLLVLYLTGESGRWFEMQFSLHCHYFFPYVKPQ